MKLRHYILIQHGSVCIMLVVALSVLYLIMINIVYTNIRGKEFSFVSRFTRTRKRQGPSYLRYAKEPRTMLVLIWSQLYEEWTILKNGTMSFKHCAVSNCEVTKDRKRILDSDAVIFHVRNISMLDIPRIRSPRQKWVFLCLEAPAYSNFQGFGFMYNMFNWTMTYRKDSDVVIPYGRTIRKSNTTADDSNSYLKWKRKSRPAVWLVSHCRTEGNREQYVKQMQNHIDIDVFGSCGYASCPFNKTRSCLENFSERYHFFLAFENSICDDYITEKLFRTLKYDMVPVVFGGGNYSVAAPRRSYIDAMDFASPKQLSNYLLRVASNYTLYSSYFEWRTGAVSEDEMDACDLCQKLHSPSFKVPSVHIDMNKWWIKRSNCRRWNGRTFSEL